jgi:hypothetical protein
VFTGHVGENAAVSSASIRTRPSGQDAETAPPSAGGSARTSRPRTRTPVRDAQCAGAVDLARAAAEEVAGAGALGEHVDLQVEGERLVTHRFAATQPGYRGWHWAVTVARAPRARVVTVNEVVLLPGADAVLAPDWVPWNERVRPGDLGPGDLLPTAEDDPRLAPGFTGADDVLATDEPGSALMAYELGFGRARVLSPEGRDDAAHRWYAGEHGPDTPAAKAAPASCATCGFLVPLAGTLGLEFGVCANELSPSDGAVVSLEHGCGAHSEGVVVPGSVTSGPPVVDDHGYEDVSTSPGPTGPGVDEEPGHG